LIGCTICTLQTWAHVTLHTFNTFQNKPFHHFFSIKNLVNFSKISSKLQILQIITTPIQHVVGTECPPSTLLDILSIRVSDNKHPPYYWLFTICPTRVFKCVLTPYQNQLSQGGQDLQRTRQASERFTITQIKSSRQEGEAMEVLGRGSGHSVWQTPW
jgi:hypothetical protein